MATEPREYVSNEAIELCLATHSLLETREDFLVALHEHFQLSRYEEAEGPGRYHVLKCWHEHRENDVEVVDVLGLCGDDLVDNVVSFSCKFN